MNTVLKIATYIFLSCVVIFSSCKKENFCKTCASSCNIDNRPLVNVQLINVGTLSTGRIKMTCASAGSKIIFAGGEFDDGNEFLPSSRVDIFDTITHAWSTMELSAGRWDVEAVTAGNKIYFAGGRTVSSNDWDNFHIVDIYDASANSWSTLQLSERRMNLSVAKIGNKIFFAGGKGGNPGIPNYVSDKVDILDLSNNSFTTSILSGPRASLSAVAAGNKIYFSGGNTSSAQFTATCSPSSRVDIYDNTTGSWSATNMNEPLSDMTSLVSGNNIFWAGGQNYQCSNNTIHSSRVEIRNINTGAITYDCLFAARLGFDVGLKNNKVIFFTGEGSSDKFDLYDLATKTWSIGVLPQGYNGSFAAMISVNNTTYVSGISINGYLSNQVWKLEF